MSDLIAALRRPAALVGYALAALVAAVAAGYWLQLDLGAHLRALWWGAVVAVLAAVGPVSALVFLGDAHTWAQATVKWRKVIVNSGLFALALAFSWSLAVYVASHEGWLR